MTRAVKSLLDPAPEVDADMPFLLTAKSCKQSAEIAHRGCTNAARPALPSPRTCRLNVPLCDNRNEFRFCNSACGSAWG